LVFYFKSHPYEPLLFLLPGILQILENTNQEKGEKAAFVVLLVSKFVFVFLNLKLK